MICSREEGVTIVAFKKAVKFESKLRLSLSGPSGAGKTYTALTLATALAESGSVAFIDTERGSASKYADLFSFDVMELDTFAPDQFIAGIHDAEEAGYAVLVIDSLSHAWNGTGGLLDIVDGIAKRKYNGNTFAAWKDATPLQNNLIDAITRAKIHIIVTMRSKQEYAQERNERTGKTEIKKVGMAPIQRDGMEYEFDIAADLDIDNTMIVQKSRCSALSGAVIPKPTSAVAETIKAWLSGAPAPARKATSEYLNTVYQTGKNAKLYANASEFVAYCQVTLGLDILMSVKDLNEEQVRDVEAAINQRTLQAVAAGGGH